MCLPACGPSRSWAFSVVGFPGRGPPRFRSFLVVGLPVCGPSRLSAIPVPCPLLLAFPVDAPSSYFPGVSLGLLFRGLPLRLLDRPSRPSGASFRRAPGLFWTGGVLLPAVLAKLPGFFERAPVAFSRRFPFRRHFLDRCPFSWIYARLFGPADGSCPLSLLSWPFFVERAPGAP